MVTMPSTNCAFQSVGSPRGAVKIERVDSSARNAVLRKEKYRNEMRVRCCHVNCQRENGAEVVVVAVVQTVAFREL
jgi:hypothetical protein